MADAKNNPEGFDDFLKELCPKIEFRAPGEPGSVPTLELNLEKMDKFASASVAERLEPLRNLMKMRQNLERLRDHVVPEKLEVLERLRALASENAQNKTESGPLQK